MICPHCEAETPPTMPYCQTCGKPVDLTFEKVQETFDTEAEGRWTTETERHCRSLLYAGAVALVVAIAARTLLIPDVVRPMVLPTYIVDEAPDSVTRTAIAPLPIEVPPIPIPVTK
jgi:hypothetical protein